MTLRKLAFFLLVLFALLTPLISPAYVAAGLLLAVWTASCISERRFPAAFRSPPTFLALLFGLLTALSAVFSRDPAVSARHLPGLLLLLLVPVAIDLVDTPGRARAVVLALAAGATALGALGIWQYLHGGDGLENRIRGTLSHYMTFSGLTMIAGCVLLGLALEERGGWRLAGLICVVPLAAVLLTFTRGAYVGILAALLVLALVRRPRGLLIAVPVLAAAVLLAPPGIRQRIRSIADLSDTTSRDRVAMVRAGGRIVADYPVFGLGPDQVQRYYPLYRDPEAPRWRVPHLHNNLVQIAASSGVFTALVYAALVALFLARTIRLLSREDRPDRAALWAGLLLAGTALAVAGLFEYNFGDTEVEMATLLVLAIPFSGAPAFSGAAAARRD